MHFLMHPINFKPKNKNLYQAKPTFCYNIPKLSLTITELHDTTNQSNQKLRWTNPF